MILHDVNEKSILFHSSVVVFDNVFLPCVFESENNEMIFFCNHVDLSKIIRVGLMRRQNKVVTTTMKKQHVILNDFKMMDLTNSAFSSSRKRGASMYIAMHPMTIDASLIETKRIIL